MTPSRGVSSKLMPAGRLPTAAKVGVGLPEALAGASNKYDSLILCPDLGITCVEIVERRGGEGLAFVGQCEGGILVCKATDVVSERGDFGGVGRSPLNTAQTCLHWLSSPPAFRRR